MTELIVFAEDGTRLSRHVDPAAIAARLAESGIEFERWPAAELPAAADLPAVLAAYAQPIARTGERYGFRSMDLVTLRPDHPERAALRQKFLREHTHDDFEVRFFTAGSGIFYLHVDDQVLAVRCCADDFISVPAGVRHWFDMGSRPAFTSLRLFTAADGWVARFTGSDIATRIPDFDALAAAAS